MLFRLATSYGTSNWREVATPRDWRVSVARGRHDSFYLERFGKNMIASKKPTCPVCEQNLVSTAICFVYPNSETNDAKSSGRRIDICTGKVYRAISARSCFG